MNIAKTHHTSIVPRMLGGIFLVSGTCIGGGILALPIVVAPIGYYSACSVLITTWCFMFATALLLLEATLAFDGRPNLASICQHTLGSWGKIAAWVAYLLLLYTLLGTYIAGLSSLIAGYLPISSTILEASLGIGVTLLLVYHFKWIDFLNRFLMIGGLASLGFLIFMLMPQLRIQRLQIFQLSGIMTTLPVVVGAFGFHIIIPTLVHYLHRQLKPLRYTLLIGSLIPLILYLLWVTTIMGALPNSGPHSLTSLLDSSNQLHHFVQLAQTHTQIYGIGQCLTLFSFCAILTSLIGVSLSLWDFLEDGMKDLQCWIRHPLSRLGATVIPPLFVLLIWPHAFTQFLACAGIFVAFLLGLLPIAIYLKGRGQENWNVPKQGPLHPLFLCLAFLFFLSVIWIEVIELSVF